MSIECSSNLISASYVFLCQKPVSNTLEYKLCPTHLLIISQADVLRYGGLIVCLRFKLLDLGQVHLRQRQLLLAFVNLPVKIDLALEREDEIHMSANTRGNDISSIARDSPGRERGRRSLA